MGESPVSWNHGLVLVDAFEANRGAVSNHLPQQVHGLGGPAPFGVGDGRSSSHETGCGGWSDLVDCGQVLGQVVGPGEFEQYDRALDREKEVARWVPLVEDLHVSGPCRVSDVDWVEQQAGCYTVFDHPRPYSVASVVDQRLSINFGSIDGLRAVGGHDAQDTHRR